MWNPVVQKQKKVSTRISTYSNSESMNSNLLCSSLTSCKVYQKAKSHMHLNLISRIVSVFPSKHLAFFSFHIAQHTQLRRVFHIFLTDLFNPPAYKRSFTVKGLQMNSNRLKRRAQISIVTGHCKKRWLVLSSALLHRKHLLQNI